MFWKLVKKFTKKNPKMLKLTKKDFFDQNKSRKTGKK